MKMVLDILIRDQHISKEFILRANSALQLYIFKKDTQLLVDCLRKASFFDHIKASTLLYALKKGFIHANSKIEDTYILFLITSVSQLSILVRFGTDLTKRDSHNRTALFYYRRRDMVQLYLDYCELIHFDEPHLDHSGKTPLFYARSSGIAKSLLDAGFSVHHKANFGMTVMDHFHHFSKNTLLVFLEYGARVPDVIYDSTLGVNQHVWPLAHVALLRSKGTIFRLNYTNSDYFSHASESVVAYLCHHQPGFISNLIKCNIGAHMPVYIRCGASINQVNLHYLQHCRESDLKAMKREGFHLRDIYKRGIQRMAIYEILTSELDMWTASTLKYFGLNFMVESEDGKVIIFKKWHLQTHEVQQYLIKEKLVDLSYKRHGVSMLEMSKEL